MPTIRADLPLDDAATGVQTGTVGEPSVAAAGSRLLVAGNWYATWSADAGATWTFVDPFTAFPADRGRFCCDQVVTTAGRRWVWLLQYESGPAGGNIQRLAVSATGAPGSWHWWDLAPTDLDPSWTKVWFDFPDIGVSAKHLYLTTNVYDDQDRWVRAVVVRWPRKALSRKGSIPHEYWSTTSAGSLRPVSGAGDTMWFGSTDITTAALRVFAWPDDSPSVTAWKVRVSGWNDTAYDSRGPGGVPWLRRCDDRVTGAFRSGGRLGFLWSSGRTAGRPQPFVRTALLDEATLRVVAEPDLWSPSTAWAYPAAAPSRAGRVGIAAYAGGSTHPALAVGTLDEPPGVAPTWSMTSVATSTHGPSQGTWGDYLTIRAHPSRRTAWVAAGCTLQGGADRRNVEPRVVVFTP